METKLQQFRNSNPSYREWSDEDLATGLYNKFYADKIEFNDYAVAIGAPHLLDYEKVESKRELSRASEHQGISYSPEDTPEEKVNADVTLRIGELINSKDYYNSDLETRGQLKSDFFDNEIAKPRNYTSEQIAEAKPAFMNFLSRVETDNHERTIARMEKDWKTHDKLNEIETRKSTLKSIASQPVEGAKAMVGDVSNFVVSTRKVSADERIDTAFGVLKRMNLPPLNVGDLSLAESIENLEEQFKRPLTQEEKIQAYNSVVIRDARRDKDQRETFRDYILEKVAADPEYLQTAGFLEDVFRVLPQLGSQVVASIIGGFALSSGWMVTQIMSGTYNNLVEQGVDHDRALYAAIGNAITQAPMEAFSAGKLAKLFTSGPRKKIFQNLWALGDVATTEFFTEWMQAYPELVAELWATNPDAGALKIIEKMTEEFWETTKQGAYEGAIGATAGLIFGGGPVIKRMVYDHRVKKAVADYKEDLKADLDGLMTELDEIANKDPEGSDSTLQERKKKLEKHKNVNEKLQDLMENKDVTDTTDNFDEEFRNEVDRYEKLFQDTKVQNELGEHLEAIFDDEECPYDPVVELTPEEIEVLSKNKFAH